jgi:hypothetical protein
VVLSAGGLVHPPEEGEISAGGVGVRGEGAERVGALRGDAEPVHVVFGGQLAVVGLQEGGAGGGVLQAEVGGLRGGVVGLGLAQGLIFGFLRGARVGAVVAARVEVAGAGGEGRGE